LGQDYRPYCKYTHPETIGLEGWGYSSHYTRSINGVIEVESPEKM
jgi:hypothetical protein